MYNRSPPGIDAKPYVFRGMIAAMAGIYSHQFIAHPYLWDSRFCIPILDCMRIIPPCFHVWDSAGEGSKSFLYCRMPSVFSKTNRNEICMEPCETCMMSDVVWYKNNPGESEITYEAACQTWLLMIKGEAFTLRLLSRFEHIIMLLLVVCIKQKICVHCGL